MPRLVVSVLVLLAGLTGTGHSQYQLVREDPFAQLSGSLQTRQAAACDGEILGLDCPHGSKIGIQIFQYGRSAPTSLVCPPTPQLPQHFAESKPCSVNQAIMMAEEMCQGKQSCSIDTGFNILSPGSLDPCPGVRKYAEVAYKCKPSSFRSRSVCGGDNMTLSCTQTDHRIAILSALFSSISSGHIYCPLLRIPGYQQDSLPPSYYSSAELDLCQTSSATETVLKHCHGQPSCTLQADPVGLGVPACNDLHVYLKTTYACVDSIVFQPQYLVAKTTTTTTTEKTTSTTGVKFDPEMIKHAEYEEKKEKLTPDPQEIVKDEPSSFVKNNQEKIVISLILAVSLGLVGVILIVLGRIYRSYRIQVSLSSSVLSTQHTDLDTLEYDMIEYVDPPDPDPKIVIPPETFMYGTLREVKPKGILKNSRTTDCIPGSPMSDIVVTYSEKHFPSSGLGGRETGSMNTQTLSRNQTFKHQGPKLSSFSGSNQTVVKESPGFKTLESKGEWFPVSPDHGSTPTLDSPDLILNSSGNKLTTSSESREQLFIL